MTTTGNNHPSQTDARQLDNKEPKEILPREIEAKLIEQEHRIVPVILNAIDAWKYWDENDPRRRAALRAIVWRMFSPATAATVGLGITATASLFVAIYSTALLEQQNKKLDQQTFLAEASRSAALVSELGSVTGLINDYASKACAKLDGRRVCWPDVDFRLRARWMAQYLKTVHSDDSLEKSEANPLRKIRDVRFIRLKLPSELQGRIVALSNAFRPYRFLVESDTLREQSNELSDSRTFVEKIGLSSPKRDTPALSDRPLSIERGILLDILTRSNVELGSGIIWAADFRNSMFRDKDILRQELGVIRLDRSDLTCTSFNESYMVSASFSAADLSYATFDHTNLESANFSEANLFGSSLRSAVLPAAAKFENANLKDINLEWAIVPTINWVQQLTQRQVKNFDALMWNVEKDKDRPEILRVVRVREGYSEASPRSACSQKTTPLEAGDQYDYKP